MKTYIGLVGEKGGGKETFTSFLEEYLKDKTVTHIRFSDLLADTLKLWKLPLTRSNLQHLAIVMNQGFGEGTLTNAIRGRMLEHPAEIVVLDGVRWTSDADLIRSFKPNFLVYITADIETRYERIRVRKEKEGEKGLAYEDFLKEEEVKTELEIPNIGQQADIKIENSGSLDEFRAKVQEFCRTMLQ